MGGFGGILPPDGGLGAEPPMGVQGAKPPAPNRSKGGLGGVAPQQPTKQKNLQKNIILRKLFFGDSVPPIQNHDIKY